MNKKSVEKIGVVGLGFIADYHCETARRLAPDAEIIGVDLRVDLGRRFERRGLIDSSMASVDDLIAARPDVVHVLTPPDWHGRVALPLLEAGIDVLLEKPVSNSLEECKHLYDCAIGSGALVGVSHNQLFYDTWERARAMLVNGDFGQITSVDVVARSPLGFLRAGDVRPWMMRASGNVLFEVAPHAFAQALDVVTDIDVHSVRAGHPQMLSNGVEFFRQWDVLGSAGDVGVRFSLAYEDAFSESSIAVRGTLGAVVVDFARNTLTTQMRSFAPFDVEGFEQSVSSAKSLVGGALSTFARTVAGKAGVERFGDPYGSSIARSIEVFYSNRERDAIDPRHSIGFGVDVVRLAEAVVETSGVDRDSVVVAAPSQHPEPIEISSPPKVVVIGGTGFIGSHLVRELAAIEPVRVLARNSAAASVQFAGLDVEVVTADSRRPDEMLEHIEPGMVVYHLSFSGGTTWEELEESDVIPTIELADGCAALGVERFIYTSSIAVYDAGKSGGTITEDTPFSTGMLRVAPYARAKAVVEEHLMKMYREREFPVVISRPGIVLGVESDPVHWGVASWRHANVCVHWGSGDNPLPIVLVEDVADAMAKMRSAPGITGQSFNLSASPTITADEYLQEVGRAAGSPIRRKSSSARRLYAGGVMKWALKLPSSSRVPFPSYADHAGRSFASQFDTSKAQTLLNWTPENDRSELIRRGMTEPATRWIR